MRRRVTAAGRRLSCVGLIIACLLGPTEFPSRAEGPQGQVDPSFKSGSDLVRVEVVVLDKKRRPLLGLTAHDFSVYEDGRRRSIDAFGVVSLSPPVQSGDDLPAELPGAPAAGTSSIQKGRVVIIWMDRSIPAGEPALRATRIAEAAIDSLGADDLAAIVTTSSSFAQGLTQDRARLRSAVESRDWSSNESDDARDLEVRNNLFTSASVPDTLLDGRCMCGVCELVAMRNLAQNLGALDDRQEVLLFIGHDFAVQVPPSTRLGPDVFGCDARLRDARNAMFRALDRSGVVVNSIDPVGLAPVGPTASASSSLRGEDVATAQDRHKLGNLREQDNLRILPDRTGGMTVLNTNSPEQAVLGIFAETQTYYLLGFRPSSHAEDANAFRSISVRVDRPGARVRTRPGYWIAPRTRSDQLPTNLLGSPE